MLSSQDRVAVEVYFREWWDVVRDSAAAGLRADHWKQLGPAPPVASVQAAALLHPNPRVRRDCLTVLDHDANDESEAVFRAALSDPVPRVRQLALHGLACERCREHQLWVADVVPDIVDVLDHDANAKVRHSALSALVALSDRDDRAVTAISRAAAADSDPLVRQAAEAARAGQYRGMGSRKAIRRRTQATTVSD